MDMNAMFIAFVVVFAVILVGVFVLWIVDTNARARNRDRNESKRVQRTVVLEEDDVYLHVCGGAIEVIDAPAPAAQPAPEPEPAPEPVPAEVQEEAAAAEAAEEPAPIELNEDSVVFQASQKLSFIEKYATLTPEDRARYDELAAYVLAKPGCKRLESTDAITFKCKSDKIMRATIRRDTVTVSFMLPNTELDRFVRQRGIKKIKIVPVAIRLETDEDLILAKQTADLTMDHILEEQQYRKERRNELRRQSRLAKEAEKGSGAPSAD